MSNQWYSCFLGLGSNLSNEFGTPKQHIHTAITRLQEHAEIRNVTSSSLYQSAPYGVTDQDDFINAVVRFETTLTPQKLLELCQLLEQQAKRQRLRHWGERSLDVDILLYANRQIATDTLTIPHPELEKRNFVLVPLAELDAHLNILDKPIAELSMSQDWTGLSLVD